MRSKGFTLIELLVTIGIFALLVGLSAPFGLSWFRTEHNRETLRIIDSALHQTQLKAMASDGAQDWVVRVTTHDLYISPVPFSPDGAQRITIPDHSYVGGTLPLDVLFRRSSGESGDATFEAHTSNITTRFHIYESGAISIE